MGKKKVRLSQDKAERMMHSLLAEGKPKEDCVTKEFPTFRKVEDLFLRNSEAENKPTTFRMHKLSLQGFCDHVKKGECQNEKCTM